MLRHGPKRLRAFNIFWPFHCGCHGIIAGSKIQYERRWYYSDWRFFYQQLPLESRSLTLTQINLQSPNLPGQADEPHPPGGNPNGPAPPCGEYQLLSQAPGQVSVFLDLWDSRIQNDEFHFKRKQEFRTIGSGDILHRSTKQILYHISIIYIFIFRFFVTLLHQLWTVPHEPAVTGVTHFCTNIQVSLHRNRMPPV